MFDVLLRAELGFPLNNNGELVRAKIPLADTGFVPFELGVVATGKNEEKKMM